MVIISAKSLTAGEWTHLCRFTQSIWQKGNFSARELANHVFEILGDGKEPLKPRRTGQSASQVSNRPTNEPTDQPIEDFGQMQRPRILVVDDNVWESRLMHRLFEARQRFEVVEAHSGAEALAAIEHAVPDLIILDLKLPDVNGEQLLETLRTRDETRDVPVVVVSAKDIDPILRNRLVAHADSIWSKGMLDRSSLLAYIETILPE